VAAAPTVLIPAYRRVPSTRRALASLLEAGARKVILIDDEGESGGAALAEEFPALEIDVLTTRKPAYWTGSIVLGIERARANGDAAVLFFNQDVTVPADYFERLHEVTAANPGALVGSAVVYASEPARVWSAGGRVEWWGRGITVSHHGKAVGELPEGPFPVDWLFGMGTFVPTEVFARIGLPDAARFPMSWGDTDFSLRARAAGIPVLVAPRARLSHDVGAYDARAAGPPTAGLYVSWLRDDRHNLSLSAHAEIWRRFGPRGLWPLSLALRVAFLLANYVRIRLLFPGEGREA